MRTLQQAKPVSIVTVHTQFRHHLSYCHRIKLHDGIRCCLRCIGRLPRNHPELVQRTITNDMECAPLLSIVSRYHFAASPPQELCVMMDQQRRRAIR